MCKAFKKTMQKEFAFFGFTAFPFSDAQFNSFYIVHGADKEKAFSAGSDLAAGFTFTDTMRALAEILK